MGLPALLQREFFIIPAVQEISVSQVKATCTLSIPWSSSSVRTGYLNCSAMGILRPSDIGRVSNPRSPLVGWVFLAAAGIALTQSGCVSLAGGLSVSQSSLNFGKVAIGQASSQNVVVKNSGSGLMTLTSLAASGRAFTISGPQLPMKLAEGQSATFLAQFAPPAVGEASGSLQITESQASTSQFSGASGSATPSITTAQKTILMAGIGVDPAAVAITVAPNIATVAIGSTQQFVGNVAGTANTAVTWKVSGAGCTGAACGTISAAGLYIPPPSVPSPAAITVTATSVADPTKSASAKMTIVAAVAVLLSISPTSATVPASGTQLFNASVTGTSNTAVNWNVSGAGCSGSSCGTVSTSASSAVYMTPTVLPFPRDITLQATSVADPTRSASAKVTLVATAGVMLGISPTSATVPASGTQTFSANVTGTSNTAVSWSVSGAGCTGSACGTITPTSASSAVYLAPTVMPSPPNVTVSATSVADSTKSDSAMLTILPAPAMPPELSVTTSSDGVAHVYSTYTQINAAQYRVSDSVISATVTNLGESQWKVDVTAQVNLSSVYWPWQTNRTPLGTTLENDIYYYPYILGMTEQAPNRNVDWTWWGLPYPGSAFAPLTVMANDSSARIVAATNWPPKRVIPYYAAQRQVLYYDTPIAAGNTASFSALITTVSGDAPHGNVPWQLAIDQYRIWLDANMAAVSYPSWMINAQGFLDIQLQNSSPSTTATALNTLWQPLKSYYPLVLFWGQMTPYAGGCCQLSYTFNPSHLPDIPNFAKSVVASGYYAGYYSAPLYSGSSGYLDAAPGASWLSNWMGFNQSNGANSFYIDTLGRRYYGNPASVMNLFTNGTIPQNTIIEGAVDIYPVAGLVSGALLGDKNGCGAPQRTPQNSVKSSYPQFGRYILRDRILFAGEANTDYRFWGAGDWSEPTDAIATYCGIPAWCNTNGPCAHGTERLAFILGNKLDVIHPKNNPVLDAINAARMSSNWMQRQPVFLNTQGLDLSHIPSTSAVRITLFQDSGGKHLIAISNPRLESGLTFAFNNKTYAVPSEGVGISILDLP